MKKSLILILLAIAVSCSEKKSESTAPESTASETEKSAASSNTENDWIVLFDGSSTDAWKGYMKDEIGEDWSVEDGILKFEEDGENLNQDMVTVEEFENFELELEWKISEGGNSGIFYLVKEMEEHPEAYYTGIEMQVLDNERHPDAKIITHRAGDLYDMKSCLPENVNPAGEWNKVRLIKNGSHVEHWMNGNKCVEYELWSEEWNSMLEQSKFAEWEDFGKSKSGKIGLQDHGDPVYYRNIRIRRL